MKNFLFSIFALLIFSTATQAQNVSPIVMNTTWGGAQSWGTPYDTLKSSTPVYLYSGSIPYSDVVIVTATSTEVSGTTAGTVSLEVSLDNVSWTPYYNSFDSTFSQTLADTSIAQTYRWRLSNFADKYVRVKWIGSGTVSVVCTAKYSAIKRQ